MKATGIVRRVDHLGRVVLPIEWRRILGIDAKDPIEIFVVGENIVLQKYSPVCVFCVSWRIDEVQGQDHLLALQTGVARHCCH
jgi:AbrB family looped-hinge helix DNA binding protein